MMKLYRPLCSDVTLRLAVDLSPGYDDCDENPDTDPETMMGESQLDNDENMLKSIRENTANCLKQEGNDMGQLIKNAIPKYGHSHGHHSCSWYSRQNTSDKTAKDIYNHEHVASFEDFQKIPLDSEFKRCVEEEGNDFKDLSNYYRLSLGENNENQYPPNVDEFKKSLPNRQEYSEFSAPCCFNEDAQTDIDYCHKRDSAMAESPRAKCLCGPTNGSPPKSPSWRDYTGQNMLQTEYSQHDTDESDVYESEKDIDEQTCLNSHLFKDQSAFRSQNHPKSMGDDAEVNNQVVNQTMLGSFYGEFDENEVIEDTKQLINADHLQNEMTKSLAEEIHDVLVRDTMQSDNGTEVNDLHAAQLPFSYPFTLKHVGHLFDKSRHHFKPAGTNQGIPLNSPAPASLQTNHVDSSSSNTQDPPYMTTENGVDRNVCDEGGRQKRCSVSTMAAVSSLELEVTHRGLHRFIPRHKDEMNVGIGDPIHVIKECDDLWCEDGTERWFTVPSVVEAYGFRAPFLKRNDDGTVLSRINLRTGERGIFPAMYANDLNFLEDSDDDEEYWKFSMKFLGSVEVTSHKGDDTLVRAINKVAQSHKGNINAASLSTLEINQYGIRMIDKSKEGHERDAFSHFFALKNISFCGTHPKNNRYFAFITKHPREYRFACHVFHGDRPTHRARDALGEAFKRFYQEYMAFTHPTEDIYME